MREEIQDMFGRILADVCTPATVRDIEHGGDVAKLWQALEESGFIGALVPEAAGGVGLDLHDAAPIAELAGRFAVPLPVAETMMLRGLVARTGGDVPLGMLTFGGAAFRDADLIRCAAVTGGASAGHVAIALEGEARLLPAGDTLSIAVPFAMECGMTWPAAAWEKGLPLGEADALELLEALTHAIQAAGALQAVFDRTLAYANERVQFGRPIGKFQAIQHQLSVMAEHLFAARMAAAVAAHSAEPDRLRVACAKARVGRAIVEATALAHSIHGAIGFTAEYDLQLFTRRLHFWRQAGGNESRWERELGAALMSSSGGSLDILRHTSEWPREAAS